jgi:hypothetical protein
MQTIAVRDFDITFSDMALKRFIDSYGVCIAHTYFATLVSYNYGRLFENADYKLRPLSAITLNKLSALIAAQKIWNPTVSELSEFFVQLEHLKYKRDKDGNLIIDKPINSNILTRIIQ